MMSSTDVSSGQLDLPPAKPKPFGAQPHLGERLFTRNVTARLPARASVAVTWMSSVDLPMPGSPRGAATETAPPYGRWQGKCDACR